MAVVAVEIQEVIPDLFVWSVFDPQVKCELNATALIINDGLVVIDPVPLEASAWSGLLSLASLRAILLTNGNHARHAEALRRAHKVPVVTSAATRKELSEIKPDVILLENELLYGISAIPIPGATAGETAYYAPGGILILGDAVIHLDSENGLQLLPEKYAVDAAQNRQSLSGLLKLEINVITFAHGTPLVQGAKEKLRALLQA